MPKAKLCSLLEFGIRSLGPPCSHELCSITTVITIDENHGVLLDHSQHVVNLIKGLAFGLLWKSRSGTHPDCQANNQHLVLSSKHGIDVRSLSLEILDEKRANHVTYLLLIMCHASPERPAQQKTGSRGEIPNICKRL